MKFLFINKHTAWAVHRLNSIVFVINYCCIHIFFVVVPVTASFPKLSVKYNRLSLIHILPINSAIFVALSLLNSISKRLGVSSINVVVHAPLTNVSFLSTFIRKGIFVLTPLTRVSLKALIALFAAVAKFLS